MSVVKMKAVGIIGLIPYLDQVVDFCGRAEYFQPDAATDFYSDAQNLVTVSDESSYAEILEEYNGILDKAHIKPDIVSIKNFEPTKKQIEEYVDSIKYSLGSLLQEKSELKHRIKKCNENIESASHFLGLGVEIEKFRQCEYIEVDFGKLPKDSYSKLSLYSEKYFIKFFPCSSDDNYYWGIYVAPIDKAEEADKVFASLFFESCDITGLEGTPKEFYDSQTKLLQQLKVKIAENEKKITEYTKKNIKEMLKYYTKLIQFEQISSIKGYACRYNDGFILTGWIPAKKEHEFKAALKKIESIEVTSSNAKDELSLSPPVELKNPKIFKPFEYYTKMFGVPKYNEIDPTPLIAITYTVLFGIMFADIGHGFVLLLVSLFMWKKMKMPLGQLLISCSVSSIIWGCVFGSVFGFEEVLNPVYKAIFNMDEKPININESSMTINIIYFAVAIGILLLLSAMALNIYSCLKRRDFENGLFGVNGIAGFIFYISVVAALVCPMILGFNVVSVPYIICFMVLPLISIFFKEILGKLVKKKQNWKPEKWGDFIVDNAFELLEVLLSYVTNTMSFLRVGGFVLVHAGMMQVVFVLANMFSTTGYVITVIIGNLFVIGLEALLVGIQVLRLEYYEMFNRFYSGDGRPFSPVKIKKI